MALATWHMSKCHRRHSFGNCNSFSRHSYASSYMRLLLQPGTRDNAYAGLLLTRPAFVTAELVHVVACICFDNRAHDMVPALAPIGKAFFLSQHKCAMRVFCNLVHVIVSALACFRQGQLRHAVVCGCFCKRVHSWCLRWLACGKPAEQQSCGMLTHAVDLATCHTS